ncbi:hypothetical protein [Mucilaginibacter sp. HD30]
MANSIKIDYDGNGFWIHEAFIEVLSEFVCRTFENTGLPNLTANIQDLYIDFDTNRSSAYSGFVELLLDDNVISPKDKTQFLNLLTDAQSRIVLEGNELSTTWLNNFESIKTSPRLRRVWVIPIKTQSLITTLEYIKQLVNGTWPYSGTSTSVHYLGFPSDNAQLNI